MKNNVIVNIYNFIRMSHVEPSVFIQDDFDTVRNQITLIRQYGFPATYALKYDALMDSRYQELLKNCTGAKDEIFAWWEITEELCRKAGVSFRGAWTEEYDERVNSAYSIGYTPEERRKLVDTYMHDFHDVFGFYPKTIGSWVLDTATVSYAAEKYGLLGAAICRDQMGTDGFTLWGGFPNGVYYPSRSNENIPANTPQGQINVPMFRLLGPDPIYNFEQDVRDGLHGVYTLEPSWLIGRNPEWISWFFECLAEEDSLGIEYAHVGQENNFLWENIKPGLEPQLKKLKQLQQNHIHIETMADSASWFRNTYRLTPPMSFQASKDWDKKRNLTAQWYACSNYRVGFLGEKGHLRIRDFFLYRQEYPSRYLNAPMNNAKSTFDALPLLFPQKWIDQSSQRPFIRLLNQEDHEPSGSIRYLALDRYTSRAELYRSDTDEVLAAFTMYPDRILVEGNFRLCFDILPVFRTRSENKIVLEHESFSYEFEITEGTIRRAGKDGLEISPLTAACGQEQQTENSGRILLTLGQPLCPEDILSRPEDFSRPESVPADKEEDSVSSNRGRNEVPVPPMAPEAVPKSCVFPAGSTGTVALTLPADSPFFAAAKNFAAPENSAIPQNSAAPENFAVPEDFSVPENFAVPVKGEIRYTLDGTEPVSDSLVYSRPITLTKDTVIRAKYFLPDGRCSETTAWNYRFGLPGIRLTSATRFDPRPVFSGKGVEDLLDLRRGTSDYLDGRWRGTLQDLDVWGELPEAAFVESIVIGFLSHHRSGIIFPESLCLYTGPDRENLTLTAQTTLPCEPCAREIAIQDFILPVRQTIKSFRLTAHRYAKMPQWCCYRGSDGVFTMADNIIVIPGTAL